MVLNKIQMFSMIGIANTQARNAVMADFASEGHEGFRGMTAEDVCNACSTHAKRTHGPFPVMLTPVQKLRIKSPVLWINDMDCVNHPVEFADGTTQAVFQEVSSDALERDRRRRVQKKEGESHIDSAFNSKLKSGTQWEKWIEEPDSASGQITGIRRVPLSHVVREKEEADFDRELPHEHAVVQGTVLEGEEFKQDARTAHQIVLKNSDEDSDAHTHVKPFVRQRNGRKDLEALRFCRSSEAARQSKINKAKAEPATLRCKSERSFSFEKFSAKLQKAGS